MLCSMNFVLNTLISDFCKSHLFSITRVQAMERERDILDFFFNELKKKREILNGQPRTSIIDCKSDERKEKAFCSRVNKKTHSRAVSNKAIGPKCVDSLVGILN